MKTLDIIYYPDPVLKRETAHVTSFSKELHSLLDCMAATMYSAQGIGLAAPQIGQLIKATVIDVSEDDQTLREFINPSITWKLGSVPSEEGWPFSDLLTTRDRSSQWDPVYRPHE